MREEEEQENFTHRVEEIPRPREVVQQRERRWRGKGETCCGNRRRGKGGRGRQRASLTTQKKFPRQEKLRERERLEKREKKHGGEEN